MRAAWYEKQGPASEVFQVGDLPTPEAGPGEVRVKLAFSGVNPSDSKRRTGFGSQVLGFPQIVPHSDGAGIIDQVGDGVPENRIGERVWIYCGQWQRAFGLLQYMWRFGLELSMISYNAATSACEKSQ